MAEDRKHLHIIIDNHSNPWGPFESAIEAAKWATKKWPDQEQEAFVIGSAVKHLGWDLWALRSPDE